ncbi:MAG: PAS domain-containing protein [Elainellaceae cyanobacterium]
MELNLQQARETTARPYPYQIREIKSQLYDLWLLLTTFQASCGVGQRNSARIDELRQVISTFLDSIYVDELISSFRLLCQFSNPALPHLDSQALTLFDSVFSTLPSLVFLQDRMGQINYVNVTVTSFWGILRERVFGKTLAELVDELGFPDDVKETLLTTNQSAFFQGQMTDCEVKLSAPNTTCHYTCVFHPIQDMDALLGIVTRIVVLDEPGAELLVVEAGDRDQIELMSSAALWVNSGNYAVLNANQAAARLFGCDRQALLTANLAMLDLLLINRLRTALQYLKPAGRVKFRHSVYLRDMAETPVEVTCSLVDGNRLLVVLDAL